jgi:hypothetical protein
MRPCALPFVGIAIALAGCQTTSVEPVPAAPIEVPLEPVTPASGGSAAASPTEATHPPDAPEPIRADSVAELVDPLRRALRERDVETLARLAHPRKGVRFEPYPFLGEAGGVVLEADEIELALEHPKKRVWGSYDGSGHPIELTFAEYFDQFVRIPEPGSAEVGIDRMIGSGNTFNNIAEVYPNATILELHHPGSDPQYGGMDWQSVRFVFERYDSRLALVAIVHDQWTI